MADNTNCWWGYGAILPVGVKSLLLLWKNSFTISCKIKHAIHQSNPLVGIYIREMKTCVNMKTSTWKLYYLPRFAANYHKLSDFKQQKFILSEFSRLEVQSQGVHRAFLSLKVLGKNLFHSFLLVSGVASNPWQFLSWKSITLISFSVITWPSPSVSLFLLFLWRQSYWIRAHPNNLILTLSHLQRLCFQIIIFIDARIQDCNISFRSGGHK